MRFRLFVSVAVSFLVLIVVSTPLIKKFGESTRISGKVKLLCVNVIIAALLGVISYI